MPLLLDMDMAGPICDRTEITRGVLAGPYCREQLLLLFHETVVTYVKVVIKE